MITAYQADRCGEVIACEPPPFNYPLEGSYVRQLLLNAIVTVVLAAIAVVVGLSVTGIGQ